MPFRNKETVSPQAGEPRHTNLPEILFCPGKLSKKSFW
jgi:hypothetical protein